MTNRPWGHRRPTPHDNIANAMVALGWGILLGCAIVALTGCSTAPEWHDIGPMLPLGFFIW